VSLCYRSAPLSLPMTWRGGRPNENVSASTRPTSWCPFGQSSYPRVQIRVMCGRRPRCKRILAFGLRSGASHVSGLFVRRHDRWPCDVVRGSGPYRSPGLDTLDPKRVLPINRSTASHHAIITLAIALSRAGGASQAHWQPFKRQP
jgi:hypothetical protein